MKAVKPISLRHNLLAASVDLLRQEDMNCLITQAGLPELISLLLHYREEGKSLYPEIYIFDDIELVKSFLPGCQFCFIGTGEKSTETLLKALKKCAPLTENGWVIYILRRDRTFEYGVLRVGSTRISMPISDALIDESNTGLNAILVHQLSEKMIEVKGVKADTLVISFAEKQDITDSPTINQERFIETVAEDVSSEYKASLVTFYRKVFLEVLQRGHGTLACVINHEKNVPKKLSDGIILEERISILEIVRELKERGDLEANSKLEGAFALIVGMMQSDGITVFTSMGEVALYNVFIKHPVSIAKTNTNGGARSRTYLTLCEMVGKTLKSAYIQSQDGKIEFSNGK